jgi:hypothetical protein
MTLHSSSINNRNRGSVTGKAVCPALKQGKKAMTSHSSSLQDTEVMISYSSSSSTTKRKRDSGVGSLTRLIARYKGHDLILLFFLYHQKEERFSSWQFGPPDSQVQRP